MVVRGSDQTGNTASTEGFVNNGVVRCTYGDSTPVPANLTQD
jgi:hypothetical protein